MTAEQPPLWRDGWATEPCGDDAIERAFIDLHGPQPDAYRDVETVDVAGGWL